MPAPGEVLEDKYRIVRQIGEGGMGAVYEAEAIRLRRRVAIKVLHGELGNQRELAARFELEAQAAGRIGSRHIVDVLDLGQLPTGAHFMVMEFLEGESLRSRIERVGQLSARSICTIASQLLEGLGAAHTAGIIHRDLKPDNVFLCKQPDGTDFVKLLDFGISKFNAPAGDANPKALALTSTGAFLGTPYYLAPEQASGSSQVDQRTDLYAVGVIFYECLTNALPYSASNFNELLFRIVLEPPVPIRERTPSVDPAFSALVERAMNKTPNERFQSAAEMKQAFEAWSFTSSAGSTLAEPPVSGFGRANADAASAPWGTPVAQERPAHRTMESWAQSRSSSFEGVTPGKAWRKVALVGGSLLLACGALGAFWQLTGRGAAPSASATALPVQSVANAANSTTPPPPVASVVPEPFIEPSVAEALMLEPKPDADPPPRLAPTRRVPGRVRAPVNSGSNRGETAVAAPALPPLEKSPAPVDTESRTRSGRVIRSDL